MLRPNGVPERRKNGSCERAPLAEDDLGTEPPGGYAAGWDINYTTAERLGMRTLPGAIVRFNNQDTTDLDDVRQVLTEVRERVRADLERQEADGS